jgi:hypothetical protein
MKEHKWHQWGVIAQCKNPYREFHYCPLCRQYSESGSRPYLTKQEFKEICIDLMDTNPMYEADSNILLVFKEVLND